jgi:hypothetical protein
MPNAAVVKLNKAGVAELLKSSPVLADLESRAERVASAAGEGFETDSEIGKTRARASVRTVSRKAMEAEAKDRALTRAIDSAGG